MTDNKHRITLLLLVSAAILLAAPFIGLISVSPLTWLQGALSPEQELVLWQIRLPRVVAAFLAGGGLAVAGLVFQALFRNVLATPFTLGIASGASLGAALYFKSGLVFSLGFLSGSTLAAFAGAGLTAALILAVAARSNFAISTLLLAGLVCSFFMSSLIIFIQYLSDMAEVFQVTRWLMGSLAGASWEQTLTLAVLVLLLLFTAWFYGPELNLLCSGEDFAISRGAAVKRVKLSLFAVVALAVGGITALGGLIGFVGIIIPAFARLAAGWEHRRLTLLTFCGGGAFLTLCDSMARTLMAPAELPVGVITALVGAPVFIWILLRQRS